MNGANFKFRASYPFELRLILEGYSQGTLMLGSLYTTVVHAELYNRNRIRPLVASYLTNPTGWTYRFVGSVVGTIKYHSFRCNVTGKA